MAEYAVNVGIHEAPFFGEVYVEQGEVIRPECKHGTEPYRRADDDEKPTRPEEDGLPPQVWNFGSGYVANVRDGSHNDGQTGQSVMCERVSIGQLAVFLLVDFLAREEQRHDEKAKREKDDLAVRHPFGEEAVHPGEKERDQCEHSSERQSEARFTAPRLQTGDVPAELIHAFEVHDALPLSVYSPDRQSQVKNVRCSWCSREELVTCSTWLGCF